MTIALVCSKEWYGYLPTVINSILWNNHDVKIYILHGAEPIENISSSKVTFIDISEQKYVNKEPNFREYFPLESSASAYLTKYIDEDRVIFLDTDIIVNGSLGELWDIDLKENYLGAVAEIDLSRIKGTPYINQGVMVMNLKKIREDGVDNRVCELLNRRKLMYGNQDAINKICNGKITILDNKFNSNRFCGESRNPIVIHSAGLPKIWDYNSAYKGLWDTYFIKGLKE